MSEQGNLAKAMSDLKEAEVIALVKRRLDENAPVTEILAECREGLANLGKRFEAGEYYIPELMYGGEVMKRVMKDLEPLLKESPETAAEAATAVIGTVRRDIHDIGKDIVVLMLQGSGLNVVDLGVDVPPEKFVETIREKDASLVGMSVFLTSCCQSIGETVSLIKEAGLRDRVSIMIGGAAASNMVAERTGCDFYGETAVDAVAHASAVARLG
jgi:methylmalonyl-CoA mutase cobalamin-binding domain/chain